MVTNFNYIKLLLGIYQIPHRYNNIPVYIYNLTGLNIFKFFEYKFSNGIFDRKFQ